MPLSRSASQRGACAQARRAVARLIALFLTGGAGASLALAQDDGGLLELIGEGTLCAAVGGLLADMPVEPAYTRSGGECVTIDPRDADADTELFADAGCLQSLAYEPTKLDSWCAAARDAAALGEARDLADEPLWTLTPGTRLNLGARSLEGVTQPWMQRLSYRTVATAGGSCELEMRVYKRHPTATGQQSLLAFHGGSWSSRLFGFLGLEFTVAHFVEQGFVVYAPFYRLLGQSEGSAACNDSEFTAIVEDAEAALEWVQAHAERFGSEAAPVVFGQSAGAQLAASLAFDRPATVRGAVLFYAPLDFADFVLRAQSGAYGNPQGLAILQSIVGVPVEQADVSLSPVPGNSFPARVAGSALNYPPVFLMHGSADELVEERQSIRLCDALAGRSLVAQDESVPPPEALREVVGCERGVSDLVPLDVPSAVVTDAPVSRLHRIREGQHALDVCVNAVAFLDEACRSGSEASRERVADSIGEAVAFAVQSARAAEREEGPSDGSEAPDEQAGNDSSGRGGSGALSLVLLLLLAGLHRCGRHAPPWQRAVFSLSRRAARAALRARSRRYR